MNQVAVVYWRNQQLDRSIPVFEELVRANEEELGPDHPDTLAAITNLGVNYKDAGRLEEAITLLKKAADASSKYPNLLFASLQLIDALVKSGKPAQAAELVPDLLESIHTRLPKNISAQFLLNLARSYFLEVKEYSNAEQLLQEALATYQAELPNDWRTFWAKSMLGEALIGQHKYDEAELLVREGTDGLIEQEPSIPIIRRSEVMRSMELLQAVYEAQNKAHPDAGYEVKAKEWRDRLHNYKTEHNQVDK
jgi:tetratricopeptide (TPR) repeat protein